jgi:Fe-S-cluster-containing dehydrogenase component
VPACVAACPTGARHFGDLADPGSAVSMLVAERGGVDLMPELGYRPTNKYLPPRNRQTTAPQAPGLEAVSAEGGFLGWVDRVLSK